MTLGCIGLGRLIGQRLDDSNAASHQIESLHSQRPELAPAKTAVCGDEYKYPVPAKDGL
jgi:hypothetical protein